MEQKNTANGAEMAQAQVQALHVQHAIDYVRRGLGADKLAVVRAQRKVQWCCRQPITTDYDDEINSLLEEWAEDSNLLDSWLDCEDLEFENIIKML